MANEINLVARMRDQASRGVAQLNKNLRGIKGAAATAGHSIITLGKVLASFAVAGLAAVTVGIGKSVQAASNLEESMNKVVVVFGRAAKPLVDWSKTTARALGISQNAALSALGTFGNLFRSMKIGETPSRNMSKSLVTLAADLASFNNASPEDVLLALRAGLVGETEPLRKFGINLNDARLRQEALRLGLVKTTKEVLPAAAKAQAAYSLILKDSTLAQGDFARTSDSLANQQRIAAAVVEDSFARIGAALLPIAAKILPPLVEGIATVATFINDKLIPAVGGWYERNKPLINQIVGFAGTALGALVAIAGKVASVIGSVIGKIQRWASENKPLIRDVTTFARGVLGSLITALGRVADFVGKVINTLVALFDRITANKALMDSLRAIVGFIAAAFQALTRAIGFTLARLGDLARWVAANGPKLRDLVSILKFLPGPAGTVLGSVPEARAHGGPVRRGRSYLVGEHGPELFRPNTNGDIVANGGMGVTVVHTNIQLDGRTIAEVVDRYQGKQYQRLSGV